jgi:translation initiation factor 3 subunit A
LSEKLRQTGKRIDHFERALRREEIPLLNEDYERQLALEKAKYEENKRHKLELAAARHKESLQLKKHFERIMPDYQTYRETIKEKRSEEFQARENEAKRALEAEKARRRALYQKRQEEIRREEEERRIREEEEAERLQKEEEERAAKEEAARKEAEEKARKREEERRYNSFFGDGLTICRKADEVLEKQRQREREAEEKIARRKAEIAGLAAPVDRPAAAPLGGLKPSANAWRPAARRTEGDAAPEPYRPSRGGSRWGASPPPTDRPSSFDRVSPRANVSPRNASPSNGAQTPPAPAPGRYVPPNRRG